MIFSEDDNVSDLTSDGTFRLKAIFLAHFVFTTLGLQGYWYPNSYLFYNSFFIAAIIWTLHQNNNGLAMKVAAAINQLAFVFDIIILSVYFPSGGRGGELFSATMAIFNLLLRLVSFSWFYQNIDGDYPKEPLIGRVIPGGYHDIEAQQPNA